MPHIKLQSAIKAVN